MSIEGSPCFIEDITTINGREPVRVVAEEVAEAAQRVAGKLGSAATSTISPDATEVNCDRCEMTFLVREQESTAGRRAVFNVLYYKGESECDQSLGVKPSRIIGDAPIVETWAANLNKRDLDLLAA